MRWTAQDDNAAELLTPSSSTISRRQIEKTKHAVCGGFQAGIWLCSLGFAVLGLHELTVYNDIKTASKHSWNVPLP